MTRLGFTQAQMHLSHHEYTRIFDDLSLSEEPVRSTDHFRKLSPLDFETEMKKIMGVPFRAQHVSYQFRQKVKLTDVFARPRTQYGLLIEKGFKIFQ